MEFTVNTIGSTIFQSMILGPEDAADTFVIKMLTNNEVEGLLPLSVIRKNLDMEVRYNVTSLVPLSQLMQEPLSKKKVMNLLKSLVAAATQSEEYMLGTEGLVMDIGKIYVNPASGEAWLIYLPVANPYACDMIVFVKQLITSLQYDQSEDFSYILQFMNAFNSQTVSTVAELHEFIHTLEKGKQQGGENEGGHTGDSSRRQNPSHESGNRNAGGAIGTNAGYGAGGVMGANAGYGAGGAMGANAGYGAGGAMGVNAGYGAGGAMGVNAGYGANGASGSPGSMQSARKGESGQAAGGMPNAFGSGALPVIPDLAKAHEDKGAKRPLFGKAKTADHKAEEKKAEKPKNKLFGAKDEDPKASPQGKKPSFAIPGMNDISGLPLTPQEEAVISVPASNQKSEKPKLFGDKLFKAGSAKASPAPAAAPSADFPPVNPYAQMHSAGYGSVTSSDVSAPIQNINRDYGNTIMINQNNSLVTVMLDENGLDSNEPTRASVTRVSNNQKMYMDKDILKIGKESDYVDFYIGNNPAISRSHADIIKKDGAFYIRDNNSKNHTYLNGKMIVPEQLISIANNDRIRLANEDLIFQLY